jgi:hypothetical protein
MTPVGVANVTPVVRVIALTLVSSSVLIVGRPKLSTVVSVAIRATSLLVGDPKLVPVVSVVGRNATARLGLPRLRTVVSVVVTAAMVPTGDPNVTPVDTPVGPNRTARVEEPIVSTVVNVVALTVVCASVEMVGVPNDMTVVILPASATKLPAGDPNVIDVETPVGPNSTASEGLPIVRVVVRVDADTVVEVAIEMVGTPNAITVVNVCWIASARP